MSFDHRGLVLTLQAAVNKATRGRERQADADVARSVAFLQQRKKFSHSKEIGCCARCQ
jgi:hypothetical protein